MKAPHLVLITVVCLLGLQTPIPGEVSDPRDMFSKCEDRPPNGAISVFGSRLLSTPDPLLTARLAPDRGSIVAACQDGTIRIWDRHSPHGWSTRAFPEQPLASASQIVEMWLLLGHVMAGSCCIHSPDGSCSLSACPTVLRLLPVCCFTTRLESSSQRRVLRSMYSTHAMPRSHPLRLTMVEFFAP